MKRLLSLFLLYTLTLSTASQSSLRIGIVADNQPYSWVDQQGAQGLSVDLLEKLGKITGLKFEYRAGSWPEIYAAFLRGELDIIDEISWREDRAELMLFTEPYHVRKTVILHDARRPLPPTPELEDLRPWRIGVLRDIYYYTALEEQGIALQDYDLLPNLVRALAFGWVDAIIGPEVSLHYIAGQAGFLQLESQGSAPLAGMEMEDFRLAVLKDRVELHQQLQQGLEAIPAEWLEQLQDRWQDYGGRSLEIQPGFRLTEQEVSYLRQLGTVRVGLMRDYAPFSFSDGGGVQGLSVDILRRLQDLTGLQVVPVVDQWPVLFELFRAGELSLPGITEEDLRIGVRPDLQPLAELLDRALSAISATERRTIENRWLGAGRIATAKAASIQLTQAESSWLDVREQQINICVYQDWMPLEGVDIGRQHAGMTANVLTLFQQRLPIHFKLHNTLDRSSALAALQSGQCDLLPLAIQTHEISQQLHFSAPWLTLPSVVLGRLEAPFINSLEELNGLPVGVSRDQGLLELVQQRYPELDLVPVDSEQEGLRRLQTGELYAYIGALNSVSYYLQELRMVDVRVIGRVPVDLPLSMATRQDDLQLQAIVQKLLSSLTQAERQGIESDWRRVRLEQRMDYSLLWKTLALVSLVLLVLFYWNRKLGTLNRKLAEANQQLALMSRCDQLTGLGNRIYVEQELPPLFNASKQKQQTFMLAVLDADHFKQVNDTRGHPVGDLCLQALAGLLQDSCNGKQQHVVRFGGEEFLIFAAGHSAETFRQLLESIREQVAALVINTGSGVPLQLTVSLGAQIRRPAVDEQLDDWMREVDQALYQAKQQGRNRVVLTSGSEVSGAG